MVKVCGLGLGGSRQEPDSHMVSMKGAVLGSHPAVCVCGGGGLGKEGGELQEALWGLDHP